MSWAYNYRCIIGNNSHVTQALQCVVMETSSSLTSAGQLAAEASDTAGETEEIFTVVSSETVSTIIHSVCDMSRSVTERRVRD